MLSLHDQTVPLLVLFQVDSEWPGRVSQIFLNSFGVSVTRVGNTMDYHVVFHY